MLVDEKNGKDIIKEVTIDCSGRYRVELTLMFYIININRIGIDHSSEGPLETEIQSLWTAHIVIYIETGIR
ncbi:hypothetical protein ACFLUU_03990 [Chloroflexota bacterium]